MSDSIQTKGKTVSDAVSEALLQLGLRRDEVEIKVLEEPKAGLLGFIGSRAAKVMVRKKPEGRRGRGRGRDSRPNDDASHSLSGGSRGGRSRGGRGRGGRNNQNRNENNNRQEGGRPEEKRQSGNRPDNNRQGGNRPDKNRQGGNRPDANRPDNNRQESSRRDENRGGRGRGRGGRGGARNDNRGETRNNARNQPRDEAAGRHRDDLRVETPSESRNETQNTNRNEGRNSNRNEGRGGSRSRRSRRVNPPENQQENLNAAPVEEASNQDRAEQTESRGTRRGSRGGRGRGRGRDDQNQDQRRDEPTTNNVEAVRQPAAEVVTEAPNTKENTSMTDDQNKPAPVETPQVEAATPAAVTPETPAPVTKPKRKGWGGGLGSRLAGKKNPQAKDRKPVRVVGESAAPAVAAPTTSREPRRESRDDTRGRSDYRERRPSATAEEVIISAVPASKYAKAVADVTVENLDAALVELTSGMLARAGFPCEVQVNDGEYRQVRISSDDDDAGMLIGRHGQTVDAVEHLVERMASNAIDDRARMNLDINEYRLRREESLAERVAEAIAEVRETGKPYHVESMDARERRLVHLEAEPVEGIRTYTMIGHGGKHVVIALDEESDEGNRNED